MLPERYPAGTMIAGRYRVLRRLGAGAMGEVLCAEDLSLDGAPVALKIVSRRLYDEQCLKRLHNEAALTSVLRHPNVVSIFDFGWDADGQAWIVMEMIEGENLDECLARTPGHRFSANQSAPLLLQICAALRAAHARGIVHRDLKPGNVIISQAGEAKVADFGLARTLDSDLKLTLSGEVPGTVCYAAPEQSAGALPDPRMDIYALGILTYELLCGTLPFVHPDPVTVRRLHREVPIPHIRARCPEVPLWLEGLIEGCTRKEPERRYPSMQTLIEILLANTPSEAWDLLPARMRGERFLFVA